MNAQNFILVVSMLGFVLIGQIYSVANIIVAKGEANGLRMNSTPPVIRNLNGEIIESVLVQQQVSLDIIIRNLDETTQDGQIQFIAIVDIRNEQNITVDLQWQTGNVSAGESQDISFSWKPVMSGTFSSKVLVISDFNNPQILSDVSQSSITVVDNVTELDDILDEPRNDKISDVFKPEMADYTFMAYMVGSDLETYGYFASEDIAEMMSASSSKNVNVIIETGGAYNATLDEYRFIDFTTVQRHRIVDSEMELLETLGNKNMGDSDALSEFLIYGINQFPAEKYVVVLWNDGSGINGFGSDTISNDLLTLSELQEAFSEAKESTDTDFELIGFDACLMASFEVVTRLQDYGKYMVSSQELEPGWGWDYEAILRYLAENPDSSGAEIGTTIADSYAQHIEKNANEYEDYSSDESITLSVIDLSKIDRIEKTFASFSAGLNNRIDSISAAQAFARTVIGTERFGFGSGTSSGYVDLYHLSQNFANEILTIAASELQNAIDDAVVYTVSREFHPHSFGISIYMPLEEVDIESETIKYSPAAWKNIAQKYRSFLERDLAPPTGSPSFNANDKFSGKTTSDDVYRIELYVYKEVITNTAAQLVSYIDDSIVVDSEGKYEYPFDKQFISLCNETKCIPVSMYIENNANMKYALFPVRLESSDVNYDVFLIYQIKGDGSFEFIGAWPGIDEEGNASRELWPLQNGDKIYSKSYQFDIRGGEKYNKQIELDSIEVTESFGPNYEEYEGIFYVAAGICDFAENCSYSDDYKFFNND